MNYNLFILLISLSITSCLGNDGFTKRFNKEPKAIYIRGREVPFVGVNLNKDEQVVGGLIEQDPSNPQYMQLAKESLEKYLNDNGIHEEHSVLRVSSMSSQVVAGSLARINFVAAPVNNVNGPVLQCNSKVLEQPWINFKDIDVSCAIDAKVGGLVEQDPSDPQYMQLAKESLEKYLNDNGIHEEHSVLRVSSVSTQVVAGSLARINFVAAPINKVNGPVLECNSRVLEQPWINFKDIDVSCAIDAIVGGLVEQDPSDLQYMQLAKESLEKYLNDNGIHEEHSVLRVSSVSSQVVAGSLARINFVAAPVNNVNGRVLECNSKVLQQPWIYFKDIDVSCANAELILKNK